MRAPLVATAATVAAVVAACTPARNAPGRAREVRVGSKGFTESVILGEIAAQAARGAGSPARHERQLGGTQVLWRALVRGDIDAYPEYTGTIAREILAGRVPRDDDEMRATLASEGVVLGQPLGFSNGYAIGMKEELAERLGIRTISDLARHPDLVFGFSNEFMDRKDGWPGLRQAYALPHRNVRGLDHDLAYRGLDSGAIQIIDLYSTDAEIRYHHLRVLADDRRHFPAYQAVLLRRADLPARAPAAASALAALDGRISEAEMIVMNGRAKLERVSETRIASEFLARHLGLAVAATEEGAVSRIVRHTREHLLLVAVSLLAAIVVGLPLGVLAGKRPRAGQVLLAAVGVVQTIPSLALLVLMIPLLGIGGPPAVVALFLYSLLPIVRNTAAGLRGIPPGARDSAEALGLPPRARLRLVELPMASPAILAGIKTSAVINIGTATLGALVGAGGYGQPILTGIRLDNHALILEGAVPAALLALVVQAAFELGERFLVPRGLTV